MMVSPVSIRPRALHRARDAALFPALASFFLWLPLNTGATAAEPPLHLGELLVSAGLEPLSAGEVASSVTVITREDIERRQARTLAELLRDVPGFAVSQAGGPGAQTQVRVRGAEANHLLVLIDGVRANDPAANDEFQYQYASTADIERIEIVRGPQSAIWGTDALAGVINIIYRKDIPTSYLGGHAEHGSFDSQNLGLDGGLRHGNLQFSAGVSFQDTDGTNIARHGDEADGASTATANATFGWETSEALTLQLSAQRVEADNEFDDFDYLVTGLPADAELATEASRSTVHAEARYQPAGSRWSGSLAAGWLDTDNDNFSLGAWSNSTAAEALEAGLKVSTLLGDATAATHRLTFAVDHETVDFAQRGLASPFGDPNQDQSYTVTGYAAEYLGRPWHAFSWTLNGRLDDFSEFEDAVTWQLAASYRVTDSVRLRGSLGTGSKAPTFIERFGFYPDFFAGNPDLEPEESRGYELGADFDLGGERARGGLAYFRQDLENEIDGFVFDPGTFLFTAQNRAGDSQRRGVEALFDYQWNDLLSLNASYTYLDARETDGGGMTVREVRRPRHAASLNAHYRFDGDRGGANLNLSYNGEMLDRYFPPPFFAGETVTLDAYLVCDLAISWRLTRALELTGRIENVWDEDYEDVLGFARPGRAVFAGLRARFQP